MWVMRCVAQTVIKQDIVTVVRLMSSFLLLFNFAIIYALYLFSSHFIIYIYILLVLSAYSPVLSPCLLVWEKASCMIFFSIFLEYRVTSKGNESLILGLVFHGWSWQRSKFPPSQERSVPSCSFCFTQCFLTTIIYIVRHQCTTKHY